MALGRIEITIDIFLYRKNNLISLKATNIP
jgi:hypothetical protein